LSLAIPVCTSAGEKVAISRRIEDKFAIKSNLISLTLQG
jgi:translation initiation factor 2 gamma subunit (eIF-2gamma)